MLGQDEVALVVVVVLVEAARVVERSPRTGRDEGRGADEDQVGVILGIADRSAVREQLPRPKPMLAELLDEVI